MYSRRLWGSRWWYWWWLRDSVPEFCEDASEEIVEKALNNSVDEVSWYLIRNEWSVDYSREVNGEDVADCVNKVFGVSDVDKEVINDCGEVDSRAVAVCFDEVLGDLDVDEWFVNDSV